jgi:1-acyl-sn-glycerol-3-phosphate acyltransferase
VIRKEAYMKKTFYYSDYNDDLVLNSNQDYKLKEDYKWVHNNPFYVASSFLLYKFLVNTVGRIYDRFFLKVSYKNRKILLSRRKEGFFLYSNHTQQIGDVFIPAVGASPRRIYTVVSPSNFGIPVIGKILTMIGALPTPSSLGEFREFREGINKRIKDGHPVIIYPEAHLWPYYTKIRPFSDTSFKMPIDLGVAAFCQTVTYKKDKNSDKPKIVVYYDGPFYPDENLSKREAYKNLHDKVYKKMCERSSLSDYDYHDYIYVNKDEEVG